MRERLLTLALAVLALFAGPVRATAAGCTLEKLAELPVTMMGPRPAVSAQINGADVRFFVDTGLSFSVLSPAGAARLGLRVGPLDPHIQMRGVTGDVDMRLTTVKTLTFLGKPYHEVDFLVGEHGNGAADGVLGQNVLGGVDMEWDLANGVLRLFHPKDCGGGSLAYWARGSASELQIQPIEPPNNQIIGTATLNGAKIHVLFDSGANRSVVTVRGAKLAGVSTDGPGVVQAGATGGAGARMVRSWFAPFQSFEIGGEQVKTTCLAIADIDVRGVDMLLGADFFLSHRIYIARSQNRVYFTYNGGPVFNLQQGARPASAQGTVAIAPLPAASAATEAGAGPADAAGFARRGAAELARHAYDAAIADYGQATELAPADPANFVRRAEARVLDHQLVLAMADLDQALKLKPDDATALVMRGRLRLAGKDEAGARADFDGAIRAEPDASGVIAEMWLTAGRFADADRAASAYIDAHPRNEDLAGVLGVRCRTRAFSGEGLDQALKDCDDAIRYRPGAPEAYASRGLVLLRLGKTDRAIADFNDAIRLQPRSPWALYGRGLAEARKGVKSQSDADLAAAAAISPQIAAEAKTFGLAS